MILVSACLIGENCKYNGGNNYCEKVLDYLAGKDFITCCPELLGGLSTPRPPAEIRENSVFNAEGEDVTVPYCRGAEETLRLCRENSVTLAILKERSPSCGVHLIYDGTFSGVKIPGQGVTARLLTENNIPCISEFDL